MKIGIDVSLAVGEKAGVGYYISNLVHSLAAIDHDNEYVLYPIFYHIRDPRFKDIKLVEERNFRTAWEDIPAWKLIGQWRDQSVDKKALLGDVDILHSNTFCAPRSHPGKLIVTIHDVSFLLYPEFHIESNRTHCLRGTIDAALYADRIIAVSQCTKRDLVRYFNVSEERIAVVHEAAGTQFTRVLDNNEIQALRNRHSLHKDYILTVGSIEPRKNHKNLILAYAQLPIEIQEAFDLVIAGGRGWLNSELPALIDRLDVGKRVRILGYLPEHDLPPLYSGASLFVYPSLYEGFGLPVIEAMSCGCATLVGDNSSLREIGEDAALFVDPLNVADIARQMQRILLDADLTLNLRRSGLRRAAEFSWEETARKTLDVYKEVMS